MTDHAAAAAAPASRSLIPLPAPIRRLFDAFPLVTYPSAPLPTSAPPRISSDDAATLHIFTTNPPSPDAPSHNPTCLAYQTYLRLRGVRFRCVPATNHAAPDGRLPYLMPPGERKSVPAEKIRRWVGEEGKGKEEEEEDTEALAFEALVESSIRDAFVTHPPPTPGR
jgi:metaxin